MQLADVRFGSKADICAAQAHVRFVPKADMPLLFDHLVGAGEKRVRYSEAKRFRGLEVDDQIEFCRVALFVTGHFPITTTHRKARFGG